MARPSRERAEAVAVAGLIFGAAICIAVGLARGVAAGFAMLAIEALGFVVMCVLAEVGDRDR